MIAMEEARAGKKRKLQSDGEGEVTTATIGTALERFAEMKADTVNADYNERKAILSALQQSFSAGSIDPTGSQLMLASSASDLLVKEIKDGLTKDEKSVSRLAKILIFNFVDLNTAVACSHVCRIWRPLVSSLLPVNRPSLQADSIPLYRGINYINILPNEIFIEIFSYLDTYDLLACQQINVEWHQITSVNASLWTENAVLCGNLNQIDKQWKRLRKLSGGGRLKRLMLTCKARQFDPDNEEEGDDYNAAVNNEKDFEAILYSWVNTELSQTFPCNSLVELQYQCYHRQVGHQVWNTISNCTILQKLRLDVVDGDDFRLTLKGKPLAQCQLQEFQLNCIGVYDDEEFVADESFYELIHGIKHLRLEFGSSTDQLFHILEASKDTLERLHLLGTDDHFDNFDNFNGQVEYNFIMMKKLTTFEGVTFGLPCKLKAPILKDIVFHVQSTITFGVLLEYNDGIESLSIFDEIGSRSGDDSFSKILREMLLEKSSPVQRLKLVDDSTVINEEEMARRDCSPGNSLNPQFPSLKRLEVLTSNGSAMTGEVMLQFLQERKQSGLLPLKKLVLIDCGFFTLQTVTSLGELVDTMEVRRTFGGQKNNDT